VKDQLQGNISASRNPLRGNSMVQRRQHKDWKSSRRRGRKNGDRQVWQLGRKTNGNTFVLKIIENQNANNKTALGTNFVQMK
jgi:hypothetical protein